MEEILRRLHVTPPGGSFIAVAVIITFLLGILLICLYAMIRPRYGPGPKTALCAASVIWFCVYFYCGVLNAAIFGVATSFVIIGMGWGIGEYLLAAVAGAAGWSRDAPARHRRAWRIIDSRWFDRAGRKHAGDREVYRC